MSRSVNNNINFFGSGCAGLGRGKMNRREFLVTGSAASVLAGPVFAKDSGSPTILGISCSPRKGKTTATAVGAALEAAQKLDPSVKVEMVDLGSKQIAGWGGANDDFDLILPKLKDPALGGIIIGSPVYFRAMSSLCKAFIERCAAVHKPDYLLKDKAVGVVAVGSYRNGGQELVIEQIQNAMLCHQAMIVGGKPGAFMGATLWNNYSDDITKDEFGMDSARKLGVRVAEAVLKIT